MNIWLQYIWLLWSYDSNWFYRPIFCVCYGHIPKSMMFNFFSGNMIPVDRYLSTTRRGRPLAFCLLINSTDFPGFSKGLKQLPAAWSLRCKDLTCFSFWNLDVGFKLFLCHQCPLTEIHSAKPCRLMILLGETLLTARLFGECHNPFFRAGYQRASNSVSPSL